MTELHKLSATEITGLIARREVSASEVMGAVIEHAERVNPAINALVDVDFDEALAEARAVDASEPGPDDPPLKGVPITIKDLTDTSRMRTTYGSRLFADHVAPADAEVVTRLRRAGSIVFAKTNTPEFGAGINTTNELHGATRNPWNTGRTAGGSSGGAGAAVAAGIGPVAEGTDHGCSVRLPAGFSGVVGLRPTIGRIPKWPDEWVYDPFAVTGPLARTVADCELVFEAMSGPFAAVPSTLRPPYRRAAEPVADVAGQRIGWAPDLNGIAAVDREVVEICARAVELLARNGASVDEGGPEFGDVRGIIEPLRAVRQIARSGRHAALGDSPVDNELVETWMQRAKSITAVDVGRAEAARHRLWQRLVAYFETHDVLATLTTQVAAFPVEQLYPPTIAGVPMQDAIDACLTCYAISITQLPAISVPVGFTSEGLPIGLQLVGRPFEEDRLFQIARHLEHEQPWAMRWPELLAVTAPADPAERAV